MICYLKSCAREQTSFKFEEYYFETQHARTVQDIVLGGVHDLLSAYGRCPLFCYLTVEYFVFKYQLLHNEQFICFFGRHWDEWCCSDIEKRYYVQE